MSDEVSIATSEGFSLEGLLDGAPSPSQRGVVVCHPHPAFGGTLDTPIVAALAEALARRGLCALRFNFRGIGRSGGKASGGLVEGRDVAAACAHLAARGVRDVAVAGYSFGALMAAQAIAAGCAVSAFVAIGFPSTIVGEDRERAAVVRAAFARVPTLMLSGTRDQFSELERLREWSAGIPGARVVALEGVGHFPTGPALDGLVAQAITFLDGDS